MTKAKNTANNSHATARADIGDAISVAMRGNVQSTNAIARIAADICVLIASSNGEATFTIPDDKQPIDVPFNAETLARYARKTLPGKSSDATDELPTAAYMIDALSLTSDAVRNAKDSMAAERAAAKKASGNPIVSLKHEAEAERLSQALNTLKAPIRRAMVLAAYVLNEGAYDAETARVQDGKLTVEIDSGETDKDGKPVMRDIAVTYTRANKQFNPGTRSAKSQGGTSEGAENSQETTEPEQVAATITAESVRKGGSQRGKLADQLKVMSGLLSDLDGQPTPKERDALARLWSQIGVMLDDETILNASKETDETDAA